MMDLSSQPSESQPEYHLDRNALEARLENLRMEQNLPLGIIGAMVGGVLGAAIWAAVTNFTDYQIGWMAIGVGFLAGFGNRLLGKGLDRSFGIFGALVALVSVLLGNFLFSMVILAQYFEVGLLDMLLGFNYSMTFDLFRETFNPIDLLFYGLAVYTGYRYSFRQLSKAQLLEGVVTKMT